MSNLLNESIVDAKALRESALKNAESVVIEKYAEEVKKTLESLLEQEEDLGLGAPAAEEATQANGEDVVEQQSDDVPLAATDGLAENDGVNLDSLQSEGEDVEVTLDLGALQEAIEALSNELDEEVDLTLEEDEKPDFPDVDGDGDRDEPITKAQKDKEAKEGDDDDKDDKDLSKVPPQLRKHVAKKRTNEEVQVGTVSEQQPAGFDGYDIDRVLPSVLDKAADQMRNPIGKVFGQTGTAQIAFMVAKALGLTPAQGQIDRNIIGQIVDMLENEELAHIKTIRNHEIGPAVRRTRDAKPLEERLFDAVMEKLTADMGAELSGWAGRPTSQLKHEQERELAHEASTESEDDAALEEEQEELNESNTQLQEVLTDNENLKEELATYQSTIEGLKENLFDVNLSNARLLYTNRVLRNSSLNERQKDKIVEAISGAGSVTEAKTIYETLQSTVEAKPKRSPQSLSEAISNRSSVLTASRKETKATSQDPFADRMRRLAGIK
jgi:hypothetical protein|tara:strand:- start:2578 stop:4068 length:1491 start_codon:yes stop_codon:yes gene_type:complete